jgi:hypothetical protein
VTNSKREAIVHHTRLNPQNFPCVFANVSTQTLSCSLKERTVVVCAEHCVADEWNRRAAVLEELVVEVFPRIAFAARCCPIFAQFLIINLPIV